MMTEYQIETRVERITDGLDRRYMAGKLTTDEYHAEIRILDQWAERQYQLAAQQERS